MTAPTPRTDALEAKMQANARIVAREAYDLCRILEDELTEANLRLSEEQRKRQGAENMAGNRAIELDQALRDVRGAARTVGIVGAEDMPIEGAAEALRELAASYREDSKESARALKAVCAEMRDRVVYAGSLEGLLREARCPNAPSCVDGKITRQVGYNGFPEACDWCRRRAALSGPEIEKTVPTIGVRSGLDELRQMIENNDDVSDTHVTVTTNEAGECVAVTRTDDEGRILSVIWERPKSVHQVGESSDSRDLVRGLAAHLRMLAANGDTAWCVDSTAFLLSAADEFLAICRDKGGK